MFNKLVNKYSQWRDKQKHLRDLKSKGIHVNLPKCGELIANRFIVFSYHSAATEFNWQFPFEHPWIDAYDIIEGQYVIGAIINNWSGVRYRQVLWGHKIKMFNQETINLTYETVDDEITTNYKED